MMRSTRLFRLPEPLQVMGSMILVVAVHLFVLLVLSDPFNLGARQTEPIEWPSAIAVQLVLSSPSDVRFAPWLGGTRSKAADLKARPVPADADADAAADAAVDAEAVPSALVATETQAAAHESSLSERLVRQATKLQRRADLTKVQRHVAAMVTHIEHFWSRPLSARNGMSVKVRIRMVPTGDLVGAALIVSSGDDIFDRSALQAIEQAAPLPVPADIRLFDQYFRTLQLVFSPQDL